MDVDLDTSVAAGFEQLLATDTTASMRWWPAPGGAWPEPSRRPPSSEAKEQIETNFWGAVRVVQHALPVMRGQGHGRIVLISSIGGIIGIPFQAFYSASKFAMEGYGEALAYEVAPFGIEVTLVEPGNVAHRVHREPTGGAAGRATTRTVRRRPRRCGR